MYPLNMHNPAAQGYALANDEAEHASLSDAGYEPKHVPAPAPTAPPAPTPEPTAAPKAKGK